MPYTLSPYHLIGSFFKWLILTNLEYFVALVSWSSPCA